LLQATRPILKKESAKNLYITILPILLVKRLINNIKKQVSILYNFLLYIHIEYSCFDKINLILFFL
ncbi:hypothetical protein, partial [Acinetobacter baumannii]|uniref:hypothetical protein n=1 Tax=Acinetobacter baumannii TaxID=470 RepID=UPI001BB2DF2E